MAGGTIRRELQSNVVWVNSGVVIRGMAARTSVWRIVVIPVVASSTIIGN